MDDTALTFRAELERTRPAQRNLGYPPDLRRRVGRWAAQRHDEGAGFTLLARDLGISAKSLGEWARSAEAPSGTESVEFLPVDVDSGGVSGREADCPTLHAPGGYRVTGLCVAEIVAVLRGLE